MLDPMAGLYRTFAQAEKEQKEILEQVSKANKEKLDREIKVVEEAEKTRLILDEFKATVQEFIKSSTDQIIASKETNKTMKKWTKAIGWMTLTMVLFTAATLYFTYLSYIKP